MNSASAVHRCGFDSFWRSFIDTSSELVGLRVSWLEVFCVLTRISVLGCLTMTSGLTPAGCGASCLRVVLVGICFFALRRSPEKMSKIALS